MSFWQYLDAHPVGGGIVLAAVCVTALVVAEMFAVAISRRN